MIVLDLSFWGGGVSFWMEAICKSGPVLGIFITFVSIAPHPTCGVLLHLRLAACSRYYLALVVRALHRLVWRPGYMLLNNRSLRVRSSCGKVLLMALSRRFLIGQVLLDGIAQQHLTSLAPCGPVRFDRDLPDTAKGCALASQNSEANSWVVAAYRLDIPCTGCTDPLRLLVPDFHLPAGFAYARIMLRTSRLRRVILCHKCGRAFHYLWFEFYLKQILDLHLLIGLVRAWLSYRTSTLENVSSKIGDGSVGRPSDSR